MVKETSWGLGAPLGPRGCCPDTPEGPWAPRCAQGAGLGVGFDVFCLETSMQAVGVGALSEYSQVSPRAAQKGLARGGSQARPPVQALARTPAPGAPCPRDASTQHDAHFAQNHGGPAVAGAAAPRGFRAWPRPWPRTEPEPRAASPGPPPSEGLGGWEQAGAAFLSDAD